VLKQLTHPDSGLTDTQ